MFDNYIKNLKGLPSGNSFVFKEEQKDILRVLNSSKEVFNIIYKEKNSGCSTAMMIYVFYLMLSKPRVRILIVFDDIKEHEMMKEFILNNERIFNLNLLHNLKISKERVELSNGSIIFFKKYHSELRGFSYDVVYLSNLKKNIGSELIYNLLISIIHKSDSKFIISTDDYGIKNRCFENTTIEEIFGKKYLIKRKMLTEKNNRKIKISYKS